MNASNRAVAILAIVVTLLSASFVGIVFSDDADASSTPTELIHMGTASDNITSDNPAVIEYGGEPAVEVYVNSNLSDGESAESWDKTVYFRFVSDALKGYNIYIYDTWYFTDGSSDEYNGNNALNRSNEYWNTNAWSSLRPVNLTMDSGVNRIVIHAYINDQDSGYSGKPDRLSGTNEVTFDFTLGRTDGYTYVTKVSYDINYSGGSNPNATSTDPVYRPSASTENVKVKIAGEQTRSGYTHVGWNTSSSGNGTHYDVGATIDVRIGSEITLYAEWQIDSHSIALYTTDDSNPWKTVSVQHGQHLSIEDPTAPEGKLFAGWYTDNTRTQPYDYPSVTADDSLYALFVDELAFTTTPTASQNVTPIEPEGTFMFSSLGSESAAKVLWEFPDGTTSTDRVTTHWFEPGSYKVKLTVWNSLGEASTTEIQVEVGEEPDEDSNVLIWVTAGIAVVIVAVVVARRFI